MDIIKRNMLTLAFALSLISAYAPAAQANNYGVNLTPNPSVETVSAADSTMPESWTKELYGNNTATFSYLTTGHTGSRSLRVDITRYRDGDSHFNFLSQPVTAGAEYDFSFWYRSDVTTETDAEVLLANGETVWVYIADVPASADWKQYTATVTMPSRAVKANVYATIFSVGYLTTDDYSFAARPVAADPVFSLAPGSYVGAQTLSITSATGSAKIYYTTNGRTPTASSTLYTGPIDIAKTMTVKAIALVEDYADGAVISGKYTIQANAPTFSPAEGTYAGTQNVTIADAMPGAKIYYTTNGNTPTVYSNLYSAPINISSTKTVKAIAVVSGCTKSAVASSKYTIVSQVAAAPIFSPAEGNYGSAQTVSIASATLGAEIRYTVDGTDPTTASTLYTAPITVSSTTTVKAIAIAAGYANSAITSALYTISMQTAAVPNFGLVEGKYCLDHLIPISSATPEALIYFTTDGTTPTSASTLYTAPVAFAGSMTIKAIATAPGYADSAVVSAVYTKGDNEPEVVFSPPPGIYDTPQTVTISYETESVCKDAISDYEFVTNDGISFNEDGTIKVASSGNIIIIFHTIFLYDEGTSEETVVMQYNYTIESPIPAAPTFSPDEGTYGSAQTVSMATDYAAAEIYYTTDGTDPTAASTLYTGPITVSSSMTIKAFAILGSNGSTMASATYVINPPTEIGPTFTPESGDCLAYQAVSIIGNFEISDIYYTTDGTDPTAASTLYTGPITVSDTTTIKAIEKVGSYISPISAATYNIVPYVYIEDDTAWADAWVSDISVVTDDKVVGSSSVKLATSIRSFPGGISKDFTASPLDLSGRGIRFFVKSSDWSKVTSAELWFTSGELIQEPNSTFFLDIKQYLQDSANNEWIEITVPTYGFSAAASPDWNDIKRIEFRIKDDGISPADMSMDGLSYYGLNS